MPIPELPVFSLDDFNEAAVRAEIVDPILRALGYMAGTPNNIVREPVLRYGRKFLGHKKRSDPELTGRPDYILEVESVGRWTVEVKGAGVQLSVNDFEQAQSYALHVNVSASLFVITNGRIFDIYQVNASSIEDKIVSIKYEDMRTIWNQIENLLSPEGFRRHVPKILFDPRLPVAKGFGAVVRLGAGSGTPLEVRSDPALPQESLDALANMENLILRGSIERNLHGHLDIFISFGSSSAYLYSILLSKGLDKIAMTTQSQTVSTDSQSPTLFTGSFNWNMKTGDQLFDFHNWKPIALPIAMNAYCIIETMAFLTEDALLGDYAARMYVTPQAGPTFIVEMVGKIRIDVV